MAREDEPLSMLMANKRPPRVILVDPDQTSRDALTRQLAARGYDAEPADSPQTAAVNALASPPAAVVADLWMPQVSGFQLCRMLKAEPSTMDVPVILRASHELPSNRFWAERAGAMDYVPKGHTAGLFRALTRLTANAVQEEEEFFTQIDFETFDIRDRIGQHLDDALFEAAIVNETRALSSAGTFDVFFDRFIQFISQVIEYRCVAVHALHPPHVAMHVNAAQREVWEGTVKKLFSVNGATTVMVVIDEDASPETDGPALQSFEVEFGGEAVGRLALAPTTRNSPDTERVLSIVLRELGAPLRMVAMVEEVRRLASEDPLTGLRNRRAFLDDMDVELSRAGRYGHPLAVLMIDVDHFKVINDLHGHSCGDAVLSSVGETLRMVLRKTDLVARWGGEEFVVAVTSTALAGACVAAERIRSAIAEASVLAHAGGAEVRVSASIGVCQFAAGDSVDMLVERADRAMYRAKQEGRNRVVVENSDGVLETWGRSGRLVEQSA